MKSIKQIARTFLFLEPEHTKFTPAIIKHPFTDSGIVMCRGENGQAPELLNILEDESAMKRWRQEKSNQIEAITKPGQMLSLLTKPYYLTFLKYVSPYLSRQDHAKYLDSAWIMEEAPNGNRNFTPKQMTALFRQSDPQALMDQEEYQQFQQLPDTVTIYRGVTSFNAKRIKALSWTLSKDKQDTEFLLKTLTKEIMNRIGYDYSRIGILIKDPELEIGREQTQHQGMQGLAL